MSIASRAYAGTAVLILSLAAVGYTHTTHAAPAHAAYAMVVTREVHDAYSFAPRQISVRRGTIVTWMNKTDAEHNVTFDSGGVGEWNKDLKEHQSIQFRFTKPGTYRYHCEYHPYMKGAVVVKP